MSEESRQRSRTSKSQMLRPSRWRSAGSTAVKQGGREETEVAEIASIDPPFRRTLRLSSRVQAELQRESRHFLDRKDNPQM